MIYDLPKRIEICGTNYEIRSDFRAVLDLIAALNDPELDKNDKIAVSLSIFYVDYDNMPYEHIQDAAEKCFWFIRGGKDSDDGDPQPKLIDWEQDFPIIISAINRVAGFDVRTVEYDEENNNGGYHWWSFLSAFNEIGGDCTFSHVVGIRNKLARNKPLDKTDKEWYRQNRDLVDFKRKYTSEEDEMIKDWI